MNRRVPRSLALASGAALVAGTLLVSSPASAFDVTVDNEADLVTQIGLANANPDLDIIRLTGSGFTLTADLPTITKPVQLIGPEDEVFTIDGDSNSFRGFIFDKAGDSTISSITLIDTRAEGIQANDTNLTVSDVVVEGSEHGIFISDGDPLDDIEVEVTISDSTFNLNNDTGIGVWLQGSSTILLTGVEASGNGGDGINLEIQGDAVATLNTITISGSGDDGLDANADPGGVITVTGAVVTDNDGDGIDIWVVGGAVVLDDVHVSLSGDNGIEILVRNTTVADDTLYGAVTITGSVVQQSADDGVNVEIFDESMLDINSTVIETSGESGVRIDNSDGDDGDRADGSQVTIVQSTIRDNGDTDVLGGGMHIIDPRGLLVVIDSSTISGNTAHEGGGLFADGEALGLVISNSTISGNTAGYFGGIGVWGDQVGGVLALLNSTVTANTATVAGASGVEVGEEIEPLISHSIIAGNAGGSADLFFLDPIGTIHYSFIGSGNVDVDTVFAAGTGNLSGTNPQLGALADNGGPTLTHLPLPGSPVINAGDPAFAAVAFDQRGEGFPRVVGGRVDMGSVEAPASLPASGSELGGALAAGLGLLLAGGLALGIRRRAA